MAFKIPEHFSLLKKEKIKESNTTVFFYEHIKTKASVLYFQNENESAAFGTSFKTPAENSKGTTHILEHAVFDGSKKYDRENALEFIDNNSLSSFINAMTYPDKTIYLFSSSFQKDFLNNLDIYLDFMYFPNLEEHTLRREGHFFKKTEAGYEFNGIVFNEMSNSLLGFGSKLWQSTSNFFQPDNTYSHVSGGNPLNIVDLTVEELRSYHKDKYHPSNSHTILYGKINKNKVFEKLNEVFSQFEYEPKNFEILATPIGENKKMLIEYQDMDGDDNKFVRFYLFKGIDSPEDIIGLEISKNYYLSYDFSPLKRLIEDSGYCGSLEVHLDEDIKYPILSIICHGVKDSDIEKLENLIDENIYKFSTNILPETKELLKRIYQFKLKEIEFSQYKGLDVVLSTSKYLNFGLDPLTELRSYKNLRIIEKLLKGKNLEKFLREKFLPAQHLSIKFSPNKSLIEDYTKEIKNKLKEKISLLDLKQLDLEIENHEKLLTKERVEVKYPNLKKLKIQDLGLKTAKFDSELKNNTFNTYLNTDDLVRLGLNFDLADFNFSKLEYLLIYLGIVNQLPTKNYDFKNFDFLKKKYFADFNLSNLFFYNGSENKKIFLANLFVKFLESDQEKVLEIIKEFIINIDFTNKERVKFLLQDQYQYIKEDISRDPSVHAVMKASSFFSEFEYINYNLYSLPMQNKLKFILENFDAEFESLKNEFQLIHNYIFNQNCIFNFGISKKTASFADKFSKNLTHETNIHPGEIKNLGNLVIPNFNQKIKNQNFFLPSNSDTNFNIMSVKYKKIENADKDVIQIINSYMHQYLWDNLRVKNGAYGARYHIDRNFEYGVFESISDPKINESFKIYSKTRTNFDLSNFKKYAFEKMKLKSLSTNKYVYTNADIYNLSFKFLIEGRDFNLRQEELSRKVALGFVQFKKLFNNLKNIEACVKVIATTKERIKDFTETYEKLS